MSNNNFDFDFDFDFSFDQSVYLDSAWDTTGTEGTPTGECSPGGASTGTWHSSEPSPDGWSPGESPTGAWHSGELSPENLGHPYGLIGSINLLLEAQDSANQTPESLNGESWIATASSRDLTALGLSQFPQNIAVHALPPNTQSSEYSPAIYSQSQQVPVFAHGEQIPGDHSPATPAQGGLLNGSASILPSTRTKCPHCGKFFGTDRDKRRHIQTVCQVNEHDRCYYRCCCGHKSRRRDNYLRHLRSRTGRCRELNATFICGCGEVHHYGREHLTHVKKCVAKRGRPASYC